MMDDSAIPEAPPAAPSRFGFLRHAWVRLILVVVIAVFATSPLAIRYCRNLAIEREKDDIRELLIFEAIRSQERTERYPVYFISIEGRKDPSSRLLSLLAAHNLTVLPLSEGVQEQKPGGVDPQTGITYSFLTGKYKHPTTGQEGLVLEVVSLDMTDHGEATAEYGADFGPMLAGGPIVLLVKENGKWRIARTIGYWSG